MLHQIGVGALGPVFRTYEPERDRLVAIKVFRLDITPEQAQSLADELVRAAEAGLFHPSVVEPIAAGVEGSVAYRAEEYVAAESLDVAMRHYAPAPLTTVLPFITQLAGAIDFARAAGVGHGALHPRDIFVTPDEARATGFGVVEALERVGLRAPIRRPYTPPERIAGDGWNTTADVFSLAAISFELLTGRRPAGLGHEIGPLTSGTPNPWMDALHGVLAHAMNANPADRYPTALAFASALEAAGRGQSEAGVAAPVPAPTAAADPGINPLAAAAAIAAAPVVAPPPAPRPPQDSTELRRSAETLRAKPEAGSHDRSEEQDDDIVAERDEDDAHQQLMVDDASQIDPRLEPHDLQLDEDIEAEAEADRFVADDFLLEAAGVASAPAHDPRPAEISDESLDPRALDDDEVMVDEPPSALFQPKDLLHSDPDQTRLRSASAPSASAVAPLRRDESTSAATPARRDELPRRRDETPPRRDDYGQRDELSYQSAVSEDAAQSERTSGWPLALTLGIIGLLAGFGGGYAYRGRSIPDAAERAPSTASAAKPQTPVGREFSEQTVTPPAAPRTGSTPPASSATPTASPAKPETSPSGPPPRHTKPAPATVPVTTGSIVVRSTPSAAGVTVNGQWRGRTPLTLTGLPLRRYDVRVVQPGYATSREVVSLSPGEPARTLSFRLQQESAAGAPPRPAGTPAPNPRAAAPQTFTGSLYVDSRPRGARVIIDGTPVGFTPLRVPEVRIGTHVVRLELPDHRIWSTTKTITAGEEQRVTGSLERIQ